MKQKINKRFVPRQQYVEYYENGSLKSIGNYTKSDCKPIGLISFFHEADLSIGADYYDLAMVIISDGYVTLPGGFGYRKKQKKKGFEIFKKSTVRYVSIGNLQQTEDYHDHVGDFALKNMKKYFPNGNIAIDVKYNNGVAVKAKEYYENCNIKGEYGFINNKKHGLVIHYDEDGNKSEVEFNEGKLIDNNQ